MLHKPNEYCLRMPFSWTDLWFCLIVIKSSMSLHNKVRIGIGSNHTLKCIGPYNSSYRCMTCSRIYYLATWVNELVYVLFWKTGRSLYPTHPVIGCCGNCDIRCWYILQVLIDEIFHLVATVTAPPSLKWPCVLIGWKQRLLKSPICIVFVY